LVKRERPSVVERNARSEVEEDVMYKGLRSFDGVSWGVRRDYDVNKASIVISTIVPAACSRCRETKGHNTSIFIFYTLGRRRDVAKQKLEVVVRQVVAWVRGIIFDELVIGGDGL
jgi:hypothetical protein